MPELPEVEVTRRGIATALVGARIRAVVLGKPLRWPLCCDPARLVGRVFTAVGRRGKYLLLELDEGCLIVHLGMSGSLRWLVQPTEPGPHDHFDACTDRGTLRLHDPRRFGAVVHVASLQDPMACKLLGGLGVEPLSDDFQMRNWLLALRHSRQAIKQLLLSGRVVVGVGNIYACEALFRAGIRPSTPALRIGPTRARRLHAAIREVLAEAVNLGGEHLAGLRQRTWPRRGISAACTGVWPGGPALQGVRHPGAHGAAGAAQQLLLSTLSASLI